MGDLLVQLESLELLRDKLAGQMKEKQGAKAPDAVLEMRLSVLESTIRRTRRRIESGELKG